MKFGGGESGEATTLIDDLHKIFHFFFFHTLHICFKVLVLICCVYSEKKNMYIYIYIYIHMYVYIYILWINSINYSTILSIITRFHQSLSLTSIAFLSGLFLQLCLSSFYLSIDQYIHFEELYLSFLMPIFSTRIRWSHALKLHHPS